MYNQPKLTYTKEALVNLNQVAGTYDLVTASGDVLIVGLSLYVSVAGVGFTSVSLQTNQTNATTLLSAAEGVVANVVVEKNMAFAFAAFPVQLRSGQKIQYTIVGDGAAGEISVVFVYRSTTEGPFSELI